MKIEYEATFTNIDKNEIRKKLQNAGAKLVRAEFLQRRENFFPLDDPSGWIRVRDEGGKITLSYKRLTSRETMDGQQEVCLEVDSYENAKEFLKAMDCKWKNYQESKREIWKLDGVEICIDEWPFLEPFVEVEGLSEQEVKSVCEKLDFDYSEAKFCAAGDLYAEKYGIPIERINNEIPKIVFEMKNPFVEEKKFE